MDKAIEIIEIKNSLGTITMVKIEQEDVVFRAYETARLFGFSDDKECIRKYAGNARLVVMETDGGRQPVKCITIEDVVRIAEKSRLPDARFVAANLCVIVLEDRITQFEIANILLRDNLGYAIGCLKGLREQLDEILEDLTE